MSTSIADWTTPRRYTVTRVDNGTHPDFTKRKVTRRVVGTFRGTGYEALAEQKRLESQANGSGVIRVTTFEFAAE